jgi:hypothetical protein
MSSSDSGSGRGRSRIYGTVTVVGGKGACFVKITSSSVDSPLYEVQAKARHTQGSSVEVVIKTEEEPLYREFFTRVGQLCGRPVAP